MFPQRQSIIVPAAEVVRDTESAFVPRVEILIVVKDMDPAGVPQVTLKYKLLQPIVVAEEVAIYSMETQILLEELAEVVSS